MLYLLIQVITIGSLILAGGLGPAYQYYLSNGAFGRSEILSHLLLQSCMIALILSLLPAIGQPLFKMIGIENLPENFVYVIAFGILFNVIVIFINSMLMTYEQGVLSLTLLNVSSSLTNTMLFVACALLFSVDIGVALIAYFVGLMIRMIPGVYITCRGIAVRISIDWQTMSKRLFKYGAASFLFNIAVVMVFRVDAFIVNKLVGLEELGKYAVAVTLAEMVLILPSSIGTALFAYFPTLDSVAQVELLKKTCRSVIAITGTLCIVLAVISPFLVTILVGEQYVGSIAPLRAMLPGLVALAAAYVFANYFAGTGHPILGAGVFGVGLIVKIGLNYLLAPPLGIIGAALASSVAYVVIAVAFYVVLRTKQNVTAASLFMPTVEDIQVIVVRVKALIGGTWRGA
jgi:O-antigen/teichoic acid export membrane protein